MQTARNAYPGKRRWLRLALAAVVLLASRVPSGSRAEMPTMPAGAAWSRNLPIYEVNLRQYTPEGTFKAFQEHLPAIKKLGVGVIWLMPIHPSGEGAKSFGSFYCVRDYYAVNPDYGTKEDFQRLVDEIHRLGMYVMMDWVPHHSSWDNPLITQHPEWYKHDARGNIVQANGWKDVAAFDYSNRQLWRYMADAYLYWIKEFQVDGFRCDVAGGVPIEHWRWLRGELQKAGRPVLLLAEANEPRHHPAFDMTYDWNLPPIMWAIAKGAQPATAIDRMLQKERQQYPAGAVRMRFTYNHDYNWGWRLAERYGGGVKTFAVLCATLPGRPLVLGGQEVGLDRRLPGSTRGPRRPIPWVESPWRDFYTRLLNLYKDSRALYAGEFAKVKSTSDDKVYAYVRCAAGDKVLVVLNLSDAPQEVTLRSALTAGDYRELFSEQRQRLGNEADLKLDPWEYRVYVGSSQ
jgi:cyclomaltodextrinase